MEDPSQYQRCSLAKTRCVQCATTLELSEDRVSRLCQRVSCLVCISLFFLLGQLDLVSLEIQLLLALALLAFDPRLDIISYQMRLIILIAAAGLVVVLIPQIFNRLMAAAYKLVKKKTFDREHYASSRTIAKGFSLYVVGALISSLSFFFIAKTIYPELGYDQIFFVMGVGTLAGAVSMLAVFAPSGIGVREGIQLALL